MSDNLEDVGYCENCVGEDGVIFLCDAGWYCEDCFRELGNVSETIPSQQLHDGINNGIMSPFIELVKSKYYGEVGVNNEVYPDDTGELSQEEEIERTLLLHSLIDLTNTWGIKEATGEKENHNDRKTKGTS